MILFLKYLCQVIATLTAVAALYGDTYSEKKLTRQGWALLFLILLFGCLSLILMTIEGKEAVKQEISQIEARSTIYYRLIDDAETIKHAFLWKEIIFLGGMTDPVNENDAPSIFMHPTDEMLSDFSSVLLNPLQGSLDGMSNTYKNHSNYLSFTEKDALNHFLETVKRMKVMQTLKNYPASSESFPEYLMNNDLAHYQLKYLFLALGHLEDKLHAGSLNNKKRYYELRPECKMPEKSDHILSCR